MEAITREEKIMSGENLTPITRKEMFLAKLVGQEIETPSPITRVEKIMNGDKLTPTTREEIFIARASGQEIKAPTPITRKEIFLNEISQKEPTYHTIRFLNEGIVLQESILAYGEMPVYTGAEPIDQSGNDGEFIGWSPDVIAVTSDVDYVAQFKVIPQFEYANIDGSSYAITDVDGYNYGDVVLPTEYNGLPVVMVSASGFKNNQSLTGVTIPDGYITINNRAFDGCSNLLYVEIVSNLTEIKAIAFYRCTALTTIILRSPTVCTLANVNAFESTPFESGGTGGTVYVPQALITEYQNATNWSMLYAAGTCNFVAIEGSEYE
jgi:hypothetical protein